MYNEYLVPQHKIINSNEPVKGNLFVGNINSSDYENIQKLNVKAVVTVARGAETNYKQNKEIVHLRIDAEDFDDFQLSIKLSNSLKIIQIKLMYQYIVLLGYLDLQPQQQHTQLRSTSEIKQQQTYLDYQLKRFLI
ncbi:hypothetical protein pb186bvf_003334 [Paramecium bursaria]